MPLPNFGFHNKDKKEHQELKFQMAPEYVDVEVESNDPKLSGIHIVKYLRHLTISFKNTLQICKSEIRENHE